MSGALLEVNALSFRWPRAPRPTLEDVSFTLERGAHVGVVGPNGAGKSTLLKLVAGFLAPSSGSVIFDGVALPAWRRLALARRLAFVPQSAPAEVRHTAFDVVLAGRYAHVGWLGFESARDRDVARDALSRVDAQTLASRPFCELSGGEQARVLVARALAQEPDLLLLDEPTAFLDVGHRVDLYDRLHEENRRRGLTVLVVTHDLNMAAEYCDRVLLLANGRVVSQGTPAEVFTAERIGEVYRCRVAVDGNPATGAPRVTPLPRHAT
ncbi:MAG TPA: ABC transporter ATP-binding protein [bacterium]|nr:ABC transporter ATP-binding protein [bacterium]